MCRAQSTTAPGWDRVYCTKSRGHHGEHHAYDSLIDYRWPRRPTTVAEAIESTQGPDKQLLD